MQKQPNKFTLAMQKIPFVFKRAKEVPVMSEEDKLKSASAESKGRWFKWLGIGK